MMETYLSSPTQTGDTAETHAPVLDAHRGDAHRASLQVYVIHR